MLFSLFFSYCNASILFDKKAAGHVTWSHDLAQQSLLNWPTICKLATRLLVRPRMHSDKSASIQSLDWVVTLCNSNSLKIN